MSCRTTSYSAQTQEQSEGASRLVVQDVELGPVVSRQWRRDQVRPERYEGSGDYRQNKGTSDSMAGHIHAATLAFWDGYLRHDMAAKRYLESGALEKASGGVLTLARR